MNKYIDCLQNMGVKFRLLPFSTISSILNGSAAIIWSDVVRPFVKVTESTATRISKGLGTPAI